MNALEGEASRSTFLVEDDTPGNHSTLQCVKLLALRLQHHPRFAHHLTGATIELLFKFAPLHELKKIGYPGQNSAQTRQT